MLYYIAQRLIEAFLINFFLLFIILKVDMSMLKTFNNMLKNL